MTMSNSSGFEPSPDNSSEDPGILLLLVGSATAAALASGLAELLRVPQGLTMLVGILIGFLIGTAAARFIRKQKSD